MPTTANMFMSALDFALMGQINYPTDTINCALLSVAATPSLSGWKHYSDVTNELATANGYTAGGQALASKTHVETTANSWGTAWQATHAQVVGDIVIPTVANGYLYQAVVAGTTGASQPTWPTVVGEQVADGSVIWTCLGESVTIWSSAAPSWTVPASGSLAFQYALLYDATPSGAANQPLLSIANFGAAQTITAPAGGTNTFTLTPPTNGGWFLTSPA